jgi:hypothetical protein
MPFTMQDYLFISPVFLFVFRRLCEYTDGRQLVDFPITSEYDQTRYEILMNRLNTLDNAIINLDKTIVLLDKL